MSLFKLIREKGMRETSDFLRVIFEVARGANPKEVSVSPRKMKNLKLKETFNAAAKYPDILESKQFVFFGDTNHSDISLHQFFYSQENIGRMAAAGIKHIFPEIEPRFQSFVDDVASGKKLPAEFALEIMTAGAKELGRNVSLDTPAALEKKTELEAWGTGFRLMKQHGMQIHCLDDRSNLKQEDMKAIFQFMHDLKNYVASTCGLPAIVHGRVLIMFFLDKMEEMEKLMTQDLSLLKTRMDDDSALAKRMMAAAGQEKAAILFGAGHAQDPEKSLFACLGKNRAIRVDLYSKADYYADRLSAMGGKGIAPDFVHILTENTLYKFSHG